MPRLTKPAKASTSVAEKTQDEPSTDEESSCSHQEQDPGVIIQPSQTQLLPNMFIPYIEGPKMDWTVNDGLYNRFFKWHLKCENILECELAMLPEKKQCKKMIAWSGDFGMDQYVSWNLSTDALMLDTIWEKFEEFCKWQSNEVRDRFNLLTSFQQANKPVDEWYYTVQTLVSLVKYPPQKQPQSLTGTSFGFSWKMRNLSLRQWQQHRPGQVSCIQGHVTCKENGEFKGDCQAHQGGGKCPPGGSDQFDEASMYRPPRQESTRRENPLWSLDHPVTRMIQVTGKVITRKLWCQECLQEQGEMSNMWRFKRHWRFPVSSQEVSMQILS